MPLSITEKYPWGHLRNKYTTPFLNKLNPDEIQTSFNKYFNMIDLYQIDGSYRKKGIDPEFEYEHANRLTDKIKNEIGPVPEDWLLTIAYLLIGRKNPTLIP